jgi:uncharacterized protein involved in exopolysaccharide biosynthesis
VKQEQGSDSFGGDDIDLHQVFLTLVRRKWTIVGSALFGTTAAVAFALLMTNIYRAEAVLQVREESPGLAGTAGLSLQLGGLVDLAGLNGGGSNRAVALATLRSRVIIEKFVSENRLLTKLFPDDWDDDAQAWRSADAEDIPTVWQAYNRIRDGILFVTDDKKSGLVTVAVEWREPAEAARWVQELVARTNEHLRIRAIQEGEANLAYLRQQSESVQQVELQQALFRLVEAELKNVMLARGASEFALKTIDPAVVPDEHIRPRRTMIILAGFIIGLIGSVVVVLAWSAVRGSAARS